jgi:hypothetical protein
LSAAADVERLVGQKHPLARAVERRASWIGSNERAQPAADEIEIAINGEGLLRQPYIRSGLTRTRAKMPFTAVATSA